MGPMSLLAPLLSTDPASPRLTVYNEADGTRMEFSGLTLDNWANKIANMAVEELELLPGNLDARIAIDLPVSWQAAVVPIGLYTAELTPDFVAGTSGAGETSPTDAGTTPDVVFTTVDRAEAWPDTGDVVVVSNDPFGRGVIESGGTLPVGAIDFGPTVRFYGDQYFGQSPELSAWHQPDVAAERVLVHGWSSREEFDRLVMAPLAAGGSVVVVAGVASTDRVDQIAETEKVDRILS